MMFDMIIKRYLNQILTKLFIRGRKLGISTVFSQNLILHYQNMLH